MAGAKGRQVLEGLGLVDKKPTSPNTKAKPSTSIPRKAGMSNIPPAEAMVNNPNHGKPGNPKSAVKNSAPTKTPPKADNSPQRKASAPKPKTGANDSRNKEYIAARSKLNDKSSKADRDKVRDMGLKISKGIHGNQSKKPAVKKRPLTAPIKKMSETEFFKKKKK